MALRYGVAPAQKKFCSSLLFLGGDSDFSFNDVSKNVLVAAGFSHPSTVKYSEKAEVRYL